MARGVRAGARGGEARGGGGGRGDGPPAGRDGGEARGRGGDRSHRRRDGGVRGVPSGALGGGVLVRAGAASETFCGDAQTPTAHARGGSLDRGGATLPTGGGVGPRRAKSVGAAPSETTIRRLGSAPRVATRVEERAGGSRGCPRTREASPGRNTRASAARPHGRRAWMCVAGRGAAAPRRASRFSTRPSRRVARVQVFHARSGATPACVVHHSNALVDADVRRHPAPRGQREHPRARDDRHAAPRAPAGLAGRRGVHALRLSRGRGPGAHPRRARDRDRVRVPST
jgi:hypothetical protein